MHTLADIKFYNCDMRFVNTNYIFVLIINKNAM